MPGIGNRPQSFWISLVEAAQMSSRGVHVTATSSTGAGAGTGDASGARDCSDALRSAVVSKLGACVAHPATRLPNATTSSHRLSRKNGLGVSDRLDDKTCMVIPFTKRLSIQQEVVSKV